MLTELAKLAVPATLAEVPRLAVGLLKLLGVLVLDPSYFRNLLGSLRVLSRHTAALVVS